MSFKYIVEKINDNHYVLPKVGNMKVEVNAFLSEKLYESSDEELWQQIANSASYEGVTGAYLLPDTHKGFGIPIGSVVITENTIIQAGSGYDISCGVLYLKVPGLKAKKVQSKEKRFRWINEVEKRIASGAGSARPKLAPKFNHRKINDVLRYGAKALGISENLCERQYIEVPDDIDLDKIEKAYEKAVPQIASVGSGNHFIEMQCDKDTGDVWVMVHCGSRGYGWQTANHFFYEGANLRGLPKIAEKIHGYMQMSLLVKNIGHIIILQQIMQLQIVI